MTKVGMNLDAAMEKMGFGGASGQKNGSKTPILPQNEDQSDWSQLAELILESEIKDEIANGIQEARARVVWESDTPETRGELVLPARTEVAFKSLALKVGIDADTLTEIRDSIDPILWQQKKLERVIRQEQIRNRLSDYAELEYIAIRRLIEQTENGKITAPGELIAVAHMASKMSHIGGIRGDSQMDSKNGSTGVSIDMQINQVTNVSPNGDLPGPGSLGTIQLRLSHRVKNQLEASLPDSDSGEESFLDGIEMLTAKEVQKELLTIDHEKESDQ